MKYINRSLKKVAIAPLKYSPPKRNSSLLFEGDPIRVADERGDGGSQHISVTFRNCACYKSEVSIILRNIASCKSSRTTRRNGFCARAFESKDDDSPLSFTSSYKPQLLKIVPD